MRILIAEDEPFVANSIASSLQAVGFVTDVVHDGEVAWFRGSTETYSAIILDLGLPRLDGISILKRWRAEGIQTPVLVLSARGTWAERVDGIDSGADDYLPKPYQMQEVVARLRALLRRAGGHSQSVLSAGNVEVDLKSRIVSVGGLMIHLTPLEFRLVHHLVIQPVGALAAGGRILSRLQDVSRPGNLLRGGAEDTVDDRDMGWMNQQHAAETIGASPLRG